jgi:hypothetical protein
MRGSGDGTATTAVVADFSRVELAVAALDARLGGRRAAIVGLDGGTGRAAAVATDGEATCARAVGIARTASTRRGAATAPAVVAGFVGFHDPVAAPLAGAPRHRALVAQLEPAGSTAAITADAQAELTGTAVGIAPAARTRRGATAATAVVAPLAALFDPVATLLAGSADYRTRESRLHRGAVGTAAIPAHGVTIVAGLAGLTDPVPTGDARSAGFRAGEARLHLVTVEPTSV